MGVVRMVTVSRAARKAANPGSIPGRTSMKIELGRAPWKPTVDTILLEEYNYYNIPLSGLIQQEEVWADMAGGPYYGEVFYLFANIVGPDEDVSVWGYVKMTPQQIEDLENLDPEPFRAKVRTLMEKPCVIAVMVEGHGITNSWSIFQHDS